MKKKDMNLIFAAVAVLVMVKTMVNAAFQSMDGDFEEDEDWDGDEEVWEDDEAEAPYRVSDQEYEYFNDLLEKEDFDFENFDIDNFENLNFNKLFQNLSNNLEVKLAIIKNSEILKDLLLRYRNDNATEDNGGEAVSDV